MKKTSIPLIYYHSVSPTINPDWYRRFLTLDLEVFEDHLKYFTSNGYTFIQAKDVLRYQDSGSKKLVSLSFDDGYLDNFIYVYPLLKKYKAKATFFVNPLYVDKRSIVRKTLEDHWAGNASAEELNLWGFISWDEMRLMEKSGEVDIQSHTLTHAKYPVSDKIVNFHTPGGDSLYVIGSLYPERLPYYIGDKSFETLIPYGYPFFESSSSVIARKVTINPEFIKHAADTLKDTDWSLKPTAAALFEKVKTIYNKYKSENNLIIERESESDYKQRVCDELSLSKNIIESELGKNVEVCCWPHGDNNEFAHKTAIALGYKATTAGYAIDGSYRMNGDRLPPRMCLSKNKYSSLLARLKTHYRIQAMEQKFPYSNFDKAYKMVKHGIRLI